MNIFILLSLSSILFLTVEYIRFWHHTLSFSSKIMQGSVRSKQVRGFHSLLIEPIFSKISQSGSLISTNDKAWHHKRVNYLCIYSSCILTDQTWVNWFLFIWAHSQRQFFVTWEILDAEMEDGRQSWRLTAIRYHVESIFYRLSIMIFH